MPVGLSVGKLDNMSSEIAERIWNFFGWSCGMRVALSIFIARLIHYNTAFGHLQKAAKSLEDTCKSGVYSDVSITLDTLELAANLAN